MADNELLKSVRVHLSQIPEFFSKQLKDFIVKQPDFNEALNERLEASDKNIQILTQKISQMSQQSSNLSKELVSVKRQLSEMKKG